MAKQYLAAPASSAGVERVFSAARGQDARRLAQVDEGRLAQALALRGLQHQVKAARALRMAPRAWQARDAMRRVRGATWGRVRGAL